MNTKKNMIKLEKIEKHNYHKSRIIKKLIRTNKILYKVWNNRTDISFDAYKTDVYNEKYEKEYTKFEYNQIHQTQIRIEKLNSINRKLTQIETKLIHKLKI